MEPSFSLSQTVIPIWLKRDNGNNKLHTGFLWYCWIAWNWEIFHIYSLSFLNFYPSLSSLSFYRWIDKQIKAGQIMIRKIHLIGFLLRWAKNQFKLFLHSLRNNLNIKIVSLNATNIIVQTLVQAKKFMYKCHTAFQGLIKYSINKEVSKVAFPWKLCNYM